MRFILHIGRHKTGTSSLQKFLSRNSNALKERGVLYPKAGRTGIAHHELANTFSRRNIRLQPEKAREIRGNLLEELGSEMTGNFHTVILSSEAFQNADPKTLKTTFGIWNPTIIVYIREQYQYMVSSYQQKIHAQAYFEKLSDFQREFNPDYFEFLGAWEREFGIDQLRVGIFDKTELIEADIVRDFISKSDCPCLIELITNDEDANPSIGGALIEIKRIINKEYSGNLPKRLYSELGAMVYTNRAYALRPTLSSIEIEAYRSQFREGNESVRKKYFPNQDHLFKIMQIESEKIVPECILDAEILKGLNELVQRVESWPMQTKESSELIATLNRVITSRGYESVTIGMLADAANGKKSVTDWKSNIFHGELESQYCRG